MSSGAPRAGTVETNGRERRGVDGVVQLRKHERWEGGASVLPIRMTRREQQQQLGVRASQCLMSREHDRFLPRVSARRKPKMSGTTLMTFAIASIESRA